MTTNPRSIDIMFNIHRIKMQKPKIKINQYFLQLVLLSLISVGLSSPSTASSNNGTIVAPAPEPLPLSTITKYRYEGVDGCNSHECYCTTKITYQRGKDLNGDDVLITVNTLKCEPLSGFTTYISYYCQKIVNRFQNFGSRVKNFSPSKIWEGVLYYSKEVAKAITETYDNCIRALFEYSAELQESLCKAFQKSTDTIDQAWETAKYKYNMKGVQGLMGSVEVPPEKVDPVVTTSSEQSGPEFAGSDGRGVEL